MSRALSLSVLAASVALALGIGALGALATTPNIEGWYAGLEKPAWTPPDAVFGPVWTFLYVAMGVAAWWVWRRGEGARRTRALVFYGVQLVLNGLWSPVFFGMHQLLGGLVVIVLLLVALAVTVVLFFRTVRGAGWLLVPYLLWVAYATSLNAALWRLNA